MFMPVMEIQIRNAPIYPNHHYAMSDVHITQDPDLNVTEIMNTWTLQMGYPVLHVRSLMITLCDTVR